MVDFYFHTDPGHGWLEVTIKDVEALGLTVASFSEFSYRRDDTLYLEEDCDAMVFVNAWQKANGRCIAVQDVHSRGDCFIRFCERLPSSRRVRFA